MTDLVLLYHAVASLGLPGAVFLALVGSWRGWFIWKREADDLRAINKALEDRIQFVTAERDEWKSVALSGEQIARRSTAVAKANTELQS